MYLCGRVLLVGKLVVWVALGRTGRSRDCECDTIHLKEFCASQLMVRVLLWLTRLISARLVFVLA